MCKSFLKVGLFTMALAATGAFAEGTVDPNHPDARYQHAADELTDRFGERYPQRG